MPELIVYMTLAGVSLLLLGICFTLYILWHTDRIEFKHRYTFAVVTAGYVFTGFLAINTVAHLCAMIAAMN
jgi:hypothetical protein